MPAAPVPTGPCLFCGKPGVWHILAKKEGTPTVYVDLFACDECSPFAVQEEKSDATTQ